MGNESPRSGHETGPEKIPTKEEVLAALEDIPGIEGATVGRELSDEKGLYRLERIIRGDKPGETVAYEYGRKGVYPEHRSSGTCIDIVYYQDGEPVGGVPFAEFDENTGTWVKV